MTEAPLKPHELLAISLATLLTALPHFWRIPLELTLLTGGVLLVKLLMLRNGKLWRNRLVLVVVMIGALVIVLMNYGTVSGRDAGSALLVGMLMLKLTESTTHRDGMICVFLAYFLAAINFLFTQSIPTAAWMFVQVGLITYCLITLNQSGLKVPSRLKARLAFKALLQAIPIMLLMFVLFPRIPGPLWGIPKNSASAKTGFSDTMSPGNFASLAQSGAVAFRVAFEDEVPTKQELYWRGLVFWYYDGRTWHKGQSVESRAEPFQYFKPPVKYTVTLEPHNEKVLFALDTPWRFKNAANLDRNYQLFAKNDITQVYQYQVESYPAYIINERLEPFEWRQGLQLPEGYNPRTVALGERWRKELGSPVKVAQKALDYFNREAFFYTLQPPLLGFHTTDDFLFNSRRGFCEHYSSAFVTLMRAAGVPARVVVGYQGGEVNPLNNVLTVRQSDAHAWAEIWLAERGWVRVDPTAAVAPERVEQGIEAALPATDTLPLLSRESFLKGVINLWDALDNSWNQWVLGYGPETQRQFLEKFGLHGYMQFTWAMLGLVGLALLVTVMFILRPVKGAPLTKAQKLYMRYCRRLGRLSAPIQSHETAQSYARRLAQHWPEHAQALRNIANSYNQIRYQGETEALLKQLEQQIKALKPGRPRQRPADQAVISGPDSSGGV